jgi:hypothetical protein
MATVSGEADSGATPVSGVVASGVTPGLLMFRFWGWGLGCGS